MSTNKDDLQQLLSQCTMLVLLGVMMCSAIQLTCSMDVALTITHTHTQHQTVIFFQPLALDSPCDKVGFNEAVPVADSMHNKARALDAITCRVCYSVASPWASNKNWGPGP